MKAVYCTNKRCGKVQLRLKVDLFFDIPVQYFRSVKKDSIRRSDFRLEGAGWSKFIAYCPSCGRAFAPGILPKGVK